ncbi:putative F-box only protein 11 isoform X3 [Salvia miltiorrhiza]|uniref:putative F-box only protein 11 isoform X3 n=1 Tax=Salvia miltiorrhiza TaxID=226208 RepID=UPI0025AC7F26|nr:putative F-box only protein 11 isoform X3 [Salvia miltiorrhiza]
MKPDFFKNLPPEIISEILLRLPVVSIPISKCVCKRWLHLLESDDFIKSHFARSAPALVVVGDSGRLKVFELESELELDLESHDPLTKYDFPYHRGKIKSSVNGLLVLMKCVYDGVKIRNYLLQKYLLLDLGQAESRVDTRWSVLNLSPMMINWTVMYTLLEQDLGDALKNVLASLKLLLIMLKDCPS